MSCCEFVHHVKVNQSGSRCQKKRRNAVALVSHHPEETVIDRKHSRANEGNPLSVSHPLSLSLPLSLPPPRSLSLCPPLFLSPPLSPPPLSVFRSLSLCLPLS